MSYYHVRITPKSNRSHEEIKLDLSERELQDRILEPYNVGLSIVIGGMTIPPNDIERIRINQTEQMSDKLIPIIKEQRKSRRVKTMISDEWYVAKSGKDVTDKYIKGPPGEPAQQGQSQDSNVSDPRVVFVVHGRNLKARDGIFTYLRSIGLQPLEWSTAILKTGKGTPYVGEVLDAAFSVAQAIVVLMTPDDEACLREQLRQSGDPSYETQPTPQARPNVIFEAGMAMGRNPKRTIMVELGKLRPFSDIGGRHTVRIDNSTQRRQELAQRLQSAGCSVNLSGTDWHTAGDFDRAEIQNPEPSTKASSSLQYDEMYSKLEGILYDINDLYKNNCVYSFSNLTQKIQMIAGDNSEKVGYILRQMYEYDEEYINNYKDVKGQKLDLPEAISRITRLLQKNKDRVREIRDLNIVLPKALSEDYSMLKQEWGNHVSLEYEKLASTIIATLTEEKYGVKFPPLPDFNVQY